MAPFPTFRNLLRRALVIATLIAIPPPLPAEDLAKPRLEVHKAKRELSLFDGDRLIKTYHVALGTNPIPPKERKDDRKTPEGSYYICMKNPKSRFHLSLGISYPGPLDAKRGLRDGLISKAEYEAILEAEKKHTAPPWNTGLGGEVFVHGNGSQSDWTWGCVALEDAEIEELYAAVPLGTPIVIFP